MSIIRKIVDGERDPKKLAELRDRRCKNSYEIIRGELSVRTCIFSKIGIRAYIPHLNTTACCGIWVSYCLHLA